MHTVRPFSADISASGGELRNIAEQFAQARNADQDEIGVPLSRRYRRVMPEVSEAPFSKTIGELFNFDSPEWAKSIEEFASYGLDKELELFELLDFDAPGEVVVPAEDGNAELGQSTEDAGLDGLAYDVMEIS